MNFDWVRFFESTGVDHALGPRLNVRPGHVGIQCPKCGNDTKYHFSIRLDDGKVRGCWRDPSHWYGPTSLVALLANCSHDRAKEIMETGEFPVDVTPTSLQAQLDATEKSVKVWKPRTLEWPEDFNAFRASSSRRQQRFEDYLRERGFDQPQEVARAYGLRWAEHGDQKLRVVFPLRHEGKLVGWTGRAIMKARLRYKTFPEGEHAVAQHVVWNLGPKDTGRILILVEGPFDALKLDWYARQRDGIQAIALLGLNVGAAKQALLARAAARFERLVVLLDRGAEGPAGDLRAALGVLRPSLVLLDDAVQLGPKQKDPGDLSGRQVGALLDVLEGLPTAA